MRVVEPGDPAFDALWAALLANHTNPSALISESHFEYQKFYLADKFIDRYRAVVEEGGRPICGSCFDLVDGVLDAVLVPSATIFAMGTRKGGEALIREKISGLFARYNVARMRFLDQLADGGLSELSRWALDNGATCEVRFSQIIDLTREKAEMWTDVSRSIQRGVNWGRKNMTVSVSNDRAGLESLRQVHFAAAGRITRSAETWDIQARMVEAGEAFVVLAKIDKEIVSASLFLLSANECYYGVGASDRNLFGRPISHVVMWTGIEHARHLGCRRFTVGSQVWPAHHHHAPSNAPKEISISTFKSRFGGKTVPEIVIDLYSSSS